MTISKQVRKIWKPVESEAQIKGWV